MVSDTGMIARFSSLVLFLLLAGVLLVPAGRAHASYSFSATTNNGFNTTAIHFTETQAVACIERPDGLSWHINGGGYTDFVVVWDGTNDYVVGNGAQFATADLPVGDYHVRSWLSAPADCTSSPGADYDFTFHWNGTAASVPPANTTTRIDTVLPPSGTTVSTTSIPILMGATGYVNPSDYASGMQLYALYYRTNQYNNDAALGISGKTESGGSFSIPISASGTFNLSTSSLSALRGGSYYFKLYVQRPSFSLFGLNLWYKTLVATTTLWAIGTTTAIDIHTMSPEDQAILTGTSSPSFTTPDSCNMFSGSFSLDQCLTYWVIPTPDALTGVWNEFKDNFLTRAPFGYATRFVDIATTVATSSLPSLDVSVPAGYPGAGATFHLTPWDKLMGSTSMLSEATSTTDGKTFRQIVEPGWDTFVLALFGLILIHHLLGVRHLSGHSESV